MQISGLNQLLKKYKSEIENLDKQIKEKKEKLNIVYEAIQLLQQEGVIQSAFSLSSKTESLSEKYKGFSMNRAILDILSNSDKYLSGQQIYDEMIKNGFESASSDIKRDVYITIYRMEKHGKVITRRYENRKKYMIIR
ncbi:MAG: hypothetical protein JYX80_01525 [Candidatus Scalindua sediminis]|nr:hypothetical protein [Candidatus Scalindua sediminis]